MKQVEDVTSSVESGREFAKRTVVLRLSFGRPGVSRKISVGSLEPKADTDLSRLRAAKKLIESEEYNAVVSLDNATSKELREGFSIGSFGGAHYILSVKSVPRVEAYLNAKLLEREALVAKAVAAYPKRKEEARAALKEFFEESQYLSDREYRKAFYHEKQYLSYDAPASLKAISKSAYEEQAKKLAESFAEARDLSKAMLRTALLEIMSHMKERLSAAADGKPMKFKAVTGDLFNFIATFDERNEASDDKSLASLVEDMKKIAQGGTPETMAEAMREDETYREAVNKKVSQITGELNKLVSEAPRRAFSDE
jgi:hypothetical protein